ncbi:DUF4394 domain-containing protein [Mucilaginibacter phyllosphaerae]|uniref:DUF4394 domain-containing protein n=1 Tax=Mucilaginibacter phyllosphaerae TaxID=1812349 RepID=A0A4Y8A5F4_9SPHI|nr:DUF4394 domain-containing protein [Mucilaginibacter phyllosphaerae]MBB3969537.1 hypothetical protein [Mucilaginibacter phyllosphaerae]TEW63634.1 DUF4394 domain-containing protein [Mucilaginibacter phyllosphaerae]GGH23803.1 hypothetical protein GCM10007352_37890 [Mucilaginibacter phyllosphaerae]
MKTFNHYINRLCLLCAAIAIIISTSCKKDRVLPSPTTDETITGPDLALYAVTQDNQLLSLNAKNAASLTKQTTITGLQVGESILAIDFRPATGQLYGVSSSSRIYVINTETAVARAIGAAAFTPAITGAAVGFDFNPTVDRIRLVSLSGQNLRLNPETGTVAATDGVINGAAGATITAAAYTQNTAGTSTTALFVIDIANDKLYKQDPPNDGKLVEIGSLGFDAQQTGGFDISPDGSAALAVLTVNNKSGLYNINLENGKATKIKNDFAAAITSIAIPTQPVAYAVSASNELMIFNPMNPSPVVKPITGMAAGENVLGMDFRPVNGQLYILGSTSRLYTLNASSGAATAVGTAPLTTLLSGTEFGFDFNPTVDRIRVVSNTGQNLRLNPNDGLVAAIDLPLTPGTPSVTAAAYTNNFAGATTTTLFDIDTQTSMLYRQDPPNNGVLVPIGALGVTAMASNGFDIGSTSGTAYALLTVGGVTKIYTINLTTGAATAGATLTGNVKAFTLGLGF